MILLPLVDDFNPMGTAWRCLGSISDPMHVLDEMLKNIMHTFHFILIYHFSLKTQFYQINRT